MKFEDANGNGIDQWTVSPSSSLPIAAKTNTTRPLIATVTQKSLR